MFPSLVHIKLVPHLTTVLKKNSHSLYTVSLSLRIFFLHHSLWIHGEYSHNENETARKFYMKFIIPFWEPKFHWTLKQGADSLTHYVKMPGKVFLRSFLLVSRIQSSYHSASICLRNTWHLKCPAIKDLLYSPNSSLQTGKDDKKDGFIDDR